MQAEGDMLFLSSGESRGTRAESREESFGDAAQAVVQSASPSSRLTLRKRREILQAEGDFASGGDFSVA